MFQYTLTPVPLALVHRNGSLNKTDKARLLHRIVKLANNDLPTETDAVILYSVFSLHTLRNRPTAYGKVAEDILQRFCSMASEVHFVSDVYQESTIK